MWTADTNLGPRLYVPILKRNWWSYFLRQRGLLSDCKWFVFAFQFLRNPWGGQTCQGRFWAHFVFGLTIFYQHMLYVRTLSWRRIVFFRAALSDSLVQILSWGRVRFKADTCSFQFFRWLSQIIWLLRQFVWKAAWNVWHIVVKCYFRLFLCCHYSLSLRAFVVFRKVQVRVHKLLLNRVDVDILWVFTF